MYHLRVVLFLVYVTIQSPGVLLEGGAHEKSWIAATLSSLGRVSHSCPRPLPPPLKLREPGGHWTVTAVCKLDFALSKPDEDNADGRVE
ncbi:hypothetical protein BD779DRAFT_813408 [Infundibulicybe gibba]|nr:hypothetical protein BD779DRAFT_813408 [Infundibulicybe gibba]